MNQVRNEVVEYCLAEGERVGHIFFFNSERAERYSIDVRRNNAEHIYNVYGDDIAKVIMFNNNSMLTIQCINSIDIYKDVIRCVMRRGSQLPVTLRYDSLDSWGVDISDENGVIFTGHMDEYWYEPADPLRTEVSSDILSLFD